MATTSNNNNAGKNLSVSGTGKGRKKGSALRGHRRGSRALAHGPREVRDTDGNARIEASEKILGLGIRYDKRGRMEVDPDEVALAAAGGVGTRQRLLNILLPAGIGDGDLLAWMGGDLVVIEPGTEGQAVTSAGLGVVPTYQATAGSTRTVGIAVGGGRVDITPGTKGFIQVPFAGTLSAWHILSDDTGDIEFDVLSGTWAAYPTVATIVGTDPPLLSVAKNNQNTGPLTLWGDVAILANSVLEFAVTSCAGVKYAVLELTITIP